MPFAEVVSYSECVFRRSVASCYSRLCGDERCTSVLLCHYHWYVRISGTEQEFTCATLFGNQTKRYVVATGMSKTNARMEIICYSRIPAEL